MSSVAKMIETIETEMDAQPAEANAEHLRMVEALLFAASEPLDQKALSTSLPEGADVPQLLKALEEIYQKRGVNLCCVAGKYQFRTASDLAFLLRKEQPEQKRLSKAAIETLAIIAYRQPVTRGDMEDIRGVTINAMIIKQLEDRGWVEVIGHRETVGRPALFATTRQFLDDLGLDSLDQLPVLDSPAQQAHVFDSLGTSADQPDLAIETRTEPGGDDPGAPASITSQQPAHEGAADDAAQAVET